jgi:transcriptional regulator with XRE-family HTH domain
MITNERQYAIGRAAADRFAAALAELGQRTDLSPAQHGLERDGLRGQLDDLRAELAQYEALRDGRVREVGVSSLLEVPLALIQARVAAGLTQKQLADCLGVREQQVQQDEATGYASAGLDRLHATATLLGVRFEGIAHLPEQGAVKVPPSLAELLGTAEEQQPTLPAARAR